MGASPSHVAEQILLLMRGCEAVYSEAELTQRLQHAARIGRPLRVKLGMDPTAPDIHLGHTVALRKLRQFQDLGHKAVLIIGDFTARIGDPSGRSKTRPVLTPAQVELNAKTYLEQAGHVLDTSPDKLELRHNSEWLAKMDFADVLRLAGNMTLGQMLKREDFRKRFSAEEAIGLHELMYPLMQGWDSVMITADVELGGTDQTFNNLVGRDLQVAAGQPSQIVMIMPLLVGLDGSQKMSKSYGNYIAVNETAENMFGKVMSIPDSLMSNYFTLLTSAAQEQITEWCDSARTHPRDAKDRLARLIVAQFHGEEAAAREADLFVQRFREGKLRDDIPVKQVDLSTFEPDGVWLPKLLKELGLVASTSEGRRLVEQGGVTVNQQRVNDPKAKIVPADGMVIQAGKLKACRLECR